MRKFLNVILLTLPIFSFAQVPNYIPSNGLVAWFPFDGNANDLSPNSNDGIVNGSVLTSDRFGLPNAAYWFDGTDDYIYVGNLQGMLPTSSHTMTVWVNKDSDGCSNEMVLATKDNPPVDNQNLHYGFKPCVSDCQSTMCMGMDFYANSLVADNILDTGWTCWTLTYDSISLERSIYLNGSLVEQGNASAAYNGNLDFMIGATQWQGFPIGAFFHGKIDDIAVWNRVLSPNELEGICNSSLVGIGSNRLENFSIYPNPATTKLTIESRTPLAQVWVRDVAGRALRYTTLPRGTQGDRVVVDVSSLPSGIYLVEVLTQNGQRSVQKVVVE